MPNEPKLVDDATYDEIALLEKHLAELKAGEKSERTEERLVKRYSA